MSALSTVLGDGGVTTVTVENEQGDARVYVYESEIDPGTFVVEVETDGDARPIRVLVNEGRVWDGVTPE